MGNGANRLSAAELDQLKHKYDRNKDQKLTFEEVKLLVEEIRVREKAPKPVPDQKIRQMFDRMDKDKSKTINFEEFRAAYTLLAEERAKAGGGKPSGGKAAGGKGAPAAGKAPTGSGKGAPPAAAAAPGKAPTGSGKGAPPAAAAAGKGGAGKSSTKGQQAAGAKAPAPAGKGTAAAAASKAPAPAGKGASSAAAASKAPAPAGKGAAAAAAGKAPPAAGKGTPPAKAAAASKGAGKATPMSQQAAATKIQANFRGQAVRNDLAAQKGKGKGAAKGKAPAAVAKQQSAQPTSKGTVKGASKGATVAKGAAAKQSAPAASAKAAVAKQPAPAAGAKATAAVARPSQDVGEEEDDDVAEEEGDGEQVGEDAEAEAEASGDDDWQGEDPEFTEEELAAMEQRKKNGEALRVEERAENAVTKAQVATVHRLRRLLKGFHRTAKRLAKERQEEAQPPEPPFNRHLTWAPRLQATGRLAAQVALLGGRRPGLQGKDGEVAPETMAVMRAAEAEARGYGPGGEDALSDIDSEASGSADSISGNVTRVWKPSGAVISRYRHPRDKAVGLRQARPLEWTPEDWETHLAKAGALAPSHVKPALKGLGNSDDEAAASGAARSVSLGRASGFAARGAAGAAVVSGSGGGAGSSRLSRAGSVPAAPGGGEQSERLKNSRMFKPEEMRKFDQMTADLRKRKAMLAREQEEERKAALEAAAEAAAEAQRKANADAEAAREVIRAVREALAAEPSIAPIPPPRGNAAELFEARRLLEGLHAAAEPPLAAPAHPAAHWGLRGGGGGPAFSAGAVGTPLPPDLLMVARDLAGPLPQRPGSRPQQPVPQQPWQQHAPWQLPPAAREALADERPGERVWL